MSNILFKNLFRFVFLVFLQVMILNQVELFGFINPGLYILFVLLLPFETPKWLLLVSGFALGLSVDIFSHTPGLHAAATVFIAYLRPFVLNMVTSKKEYEPGFQPGIRDLGLKWFFSYSLTLVLVHHFILFYLETWRIREFFSTFLHALMSAAVTLLLIILSQLIFGKK